MPAATTVDVARLEAKIDALATRLAALCAAVADVRALLSDTQAAVINLGAEG